MKAAIFFAAVPLLLLAAVSVPATAQDTHRHPATAVTHATQGQRWATDAPLRAGMAQIRAAVDALGPLEHGRMGPEPVMVLATQIERHIAYVVAHCKLEPRADAALHGIISELGAGARALKTNPADRSVIPSMRDALQRYSLQFDDPTPASDDEPEEKR